MQLWHEFLKKLETKMGKPIVKKWLSSLKILKFDACNIYLQAKDAFQISFFEEHVRQIAKKDFVNKNYHPIKIHFSLPNESFTSLKNFQKDKKNKKNLEITSDELKNECCFSSFYVDQKNILSFKLLSELVEYNQENNIALASYNPILIYGPSGSGKTHLLMACSRALLKKGKKIFFVKAQTFTSHVVNAIRLSSLHTFRDTYRHQEVLVVDDIHLLAGKNATQEEFFHTFNELHTQGCQIILSANAPPTRLKDIEQRLISRFEWGIALPLEIPDKEALKHILEEKTKVFSLNNLSFDAKAFLIENFSSPLSLEKAIHALVLRVKDKNINIAKIKICLSDLIIEQKKESLTPFSIIKTIAKHYGIFSEDILGKSQTKECSLPRQIAMFFCREKLHLPYKKIGKLFDRDHSTVMSSIKYIQNQKDKRIKDIYFSLLDIEKKLKT